MAASRPGVDTDIEIPEEFHPHVSECVGSDESEYPRDYAPNIENDLNHLGCAEPGMIGAIEMIDRSQTRHRRANNRALPVRERPPPGLLQIGKMIFLPLS